MSPPHTPAASPTDLRQRAESELARHASAGSASAERSTDDPTRLLHELQVHQIELEMQNEELLRSRDELEASRDEYAELYDFAPVGYFSLARDGTMVRMNLAGARLLGLERAKLTGRRLAGFVARDDVAGLEALLSKVWQSPAAATCLVELMGRDGTRGDRSLELTASISARPDECRLVAVDVTERRRFEAQTRASQRLEAIGLLAGGVAHDFNNLLTVMLAHADIGLNTVAEEAPLHENLVELKAAAERGATLTRQLLAFSRRQVLQRRVVEVNPLTRGTASMLRRLVGDDIEVVLSLAADAGRVEVDPTQLEQVLMNLAINARDSMPDGGTLTLSTSNVELDLESLGAMGLTVKPGPFVLLSVRDSGVGMDRETMWHIFEPFFTTKVMGRGTGLGLSTVHGIVEQCGGGVTVDSALGRGTQFDVYLPRSELAASAPEAAGPHSVRGALRGTETVLLVEDESALRRAAVTMLTSAGYRVIAASGGADALRIAGEHAGPIHAVLTDVVMPGMTGVALAESLKRVHGGAPVVFMSGYADGAFARYGLDPSTHFLAKPFSREQLLRTLRDVLDEARPAAPSEAD